jgi:hypothetical protein
VRRNRPRPDPYNEAGEIRTETDEEYNRLMNNDKSPYNFLYNVVHNLTISHERAIDNDGPRIECMF